MPREHQDPKGLSRMLALARKRKWLYSWMTQKVSEEGTDGLTEDGPPLSGVPLPQDTSQLHLLQKGLLARGCTTAGSSSHLLDPGQMEVVVPGWGQRRWPARDPNRPPPLGPGAWGLQGGGGLAQKQAAPLPSTTPSTSWGDL